MGWLHQPFVGEARKSRTYRQAAHKRYLGVAKKRLAGVKVIRKAIGKQLRYVSRNLPLVEILASKSGLKD
ncbi:hypothetical protein [Effusibacillus consociatus]|uniref:hypothetical protein n=1 Tax=Effusibacillus consociatus TaxID=1117041 RepID=UPI003A8E03E5